MERGSSKEQKIGEQHRISMTMSRATAEKDKAIERLQDAPKASRDILNIIAEILYKASKVFRRDHRAAESGRHMVL